MRASGRRWRFLVAMAALATGLGCASGATAVARPAPFPHGPTPEWEKAIPAAPAARVVAVVDTALALRGSPYQFGGADPRSGFDCSGFVRYVFEQHDVDLPRTVAEQSRVGRRVRRSDLEAGDLVFFATTGPGPTHVGILIDADRFVHAPDTGAVVRVERVDSSYWSPRFTGARRVLRPSVAE